MGVVVRALARWFGGTTGLGAHEQLPAWQAYKYEMTSKLAQHPCEIMFACMCVYMCACVSVCMVCVCVCLESGKTLVSCLLQI